MKEEKLLVCPTCNVPSLKFVTATLPHEANFPTRFWKCDRCNNRYHFVKDKLELFPDKDCL